MIKLEKRFSEEQKRYIINHFGLLKISEIASNLNLKERSIIQFLKNKNMKLDKEQKKFLYKRRTQKYYTNNNFFEVKTNLSAYWAGFIAADGSITGNRLKIKLKKEDESHLLQFKEDIKTEAKIFNGSGFRNLKECFYSLIYINSFKIVESLKVIYNIYPKKSLNLDPPFIIDEDLIKSFILGYFDGDGTIYKKGKYLCVRFYGSKNLLLWIKDNFEKFYNSKTGNVNKKGNIATYELNPKATLFFIELLKDLDLPKLKRKWKNYIKDDQ